MTKTITKDHGKVSLSVPELQRILNDSEYELHIFDDHIEIEAINYEKSVQKALQEAKKAAPSDFLNL